MKNYVQHGDTLTLSAPAGGVEAGKGYLIGTIFAVALFSAEAGEEFEGRRTGVVTLPKASGAINEGAAVYWSSEEVTTTASGNTKIGACASLGGVAADAANVDVVLI